MKVGIGVEGPSDREFWNKVIHKYHPRVSFDIRSMKNRNNLIRETPRLLNAFRDAHYSAAFIILDLNSSACIRSLVDELDTAVREEIRRPVRSRYLFFCVAIRELEAWFLADSSAITAVLPKTKFSSPQDTGTLPAERRLKELWRNQHGQVAFNKIDFAKRIAPKFKPEEASNHSRSFAHFWSRLQDKILSAPL